jgi:predicted cupin superfamily sugar epimerase
MADRVEEERGGHILAGRAAELVDILKLQPHPEGGFFRETFRAAAGVDPADGRGPRNALTTIDFLLARGQFSAWHRVASDEVWHLLEGAGLRLWLMPPSLDRLERVDLGAANATLAPRHTVGAHWWQAAEPLGDFAYVGATVGPGFDFADFAFLRGDPAATAALDRLQPALARLL